MVDNYLVVILMCLWKMASTTFTFSAILTGNSPAIIFQINFLALPFFLGPLKCERYSIWICPRDSFIYFYFYKLCFLFVLLLCLCELHCFVSQLVIYYFISFTVLSNPTSVFFSLVVYFLLFFISFLNSHCVFLFFSWIWWPSLWPLLWILY